MATYNGFSQGLRIMRTEITRGSVQGWRKETIVDVVMSLALTTGAIPGVREVLEAACSVARASPANGGGIDAAMQQLRRADWRPNPQATEPLSTDDGDPDALTQESDGGTANCSHTPVVADESRGLTHAVDSGAPAKPMCRSLWRGKPCEEPDTCDRTHRPLCTKEACKSARDPACHDWHYRPKKNRNTPLSNSGHQGNGRRGKSAPWSKPAKSEAKRHMSQATENLYLKWKLSEMKLKQSKIMMANSQHQSTVTYRDIAARGPSRMLSSHMTQQGRHSAGLPASVLAPPPVVPASAPASSHIPGINLEPIVSQLEAIVSALTAAGIITNQRNLN